MRILLFVAALLAVAGPLPALAGEPAAAAPPSEAKMALAKRYLRATRYDELFDSMKASMLPPMLEAVTSANPDLTEVQRKAVIDATLETITSFHDAYVASATTVIANGFTEDELRAMDEFYESPLGASAMRKMPALVPALQAAITSLLPEMEKDVGRRVCAKLDCSKVKLPMGSPS